ncbi:MAG: ThuA domain-containing protein [Terriglobia bacterium]
MGKLVPAFTLVAGVCMLLLVPQLNARPHKKEHLLFFTLSAGYKHASVPTAVDVITRIGKRTGVWDTTPSQDVSIFTPQNLSHYDAIMFYTTGELPMTDSEKAAFLHFVKSGHGFVGVHSATDTFYLWEPYLELIGGYFNDHPWHQKVTVDVVAPSNPIVSFLPKSFQIYDEIYQTADFQYKTSHVLLKLDPASVDLHKKGVHLRFYGWPLAWTRHDGKGRVFYCALGHEDSTWHSARFQRLMQNGIEWTMGLLK